MKDGFLKVGAITPTIKVADCNYNSQEIIKDIYKACENQIILAVFPELCVTSYSCGDLFLRPDLLKNAKNAVQEIADKTRDCDIISIIGAPIDDGGALYNCACVLYKGEILGIVPKKNIPNYSEFYEKRYFCEGIQHKTIDWNGKEINFGTDLIFKCNEFPEFKFGIEICEDLWVPNSPSIDLALNGANIILNLSASNESIGKPDYRRQLVKGQSAKLLCAYVYASAGNGESTSDLVFSGQNIIAESGDILCESELFSNSDISDFIDLQKLEFERRKTSFLSKTKNFVSIYFSINPIEYNLTRKYGRKPFVPEKKDALAGKCKLMLKMQSNALANRLCHLGLPKVVIGISGGLDSALALIVAHHTFKILNKDSHDIIAVTMPCFGTTSHTLQNAKSIINQYGATFLEINITEAVKKHFNDIEHEISQKNVVFENAQARERTQILMDIANKEGAIVLGTGDLSELAMGYATYNGDHMSMYAINSSVPKTLLKEIVLYESTLLKKTGNENLAKALFSIAKTPISPELLPPVNDTIQQKTEEIIGPYEIIDFFLYYYLRFGFSREKVLRLACIAFRDFYDENILKTRLDEFIKRFYSQQFKRSCMPDGPKFGSISLSPRSDWRMASDVNWIY